MIGQFASEPRERSPRLGSSRQGPPDRAPWQRPERLRQAGLVALRMATVDPGAPASRVVSEPAQVRAQRRASPGRRSGTRYHYHNPAVPSRSCDEPARPPRETRMFTQGADRTKRRGGRWAIREFDSRKRNHGCSLRLMLFGVGAPDAQGMEVRLMACLLHGGSGAIAPRRSDQAALGASLSMLYEAPGGCGSAANWALGGVWSQAARVPPSTVSSAPLTTYASSEARKATAFATSSGGRRDPGGYRPRRPDRSSPSPIRTPRPR